MSKKRSIRVPYNTWFAPNPDGPDIIHNAGRLAWIVSMWTLNDQDLSDPFCSDLLDLYQELEAEFAATRREVGDEEATLRWANEKEWLLEKLGLALDQAFHRTTPRPLPIELGS